MIKAIILDADGVAVKKQELFSEKFSRDFSVPVEKIVPFFKNEFQLCRVGKADMKVELEKYFPSWNWTKSADDFLKLWFHHDLDEKVISLVQELRKNGVKCYICTNNEKYRFDYLINKLQMKKYFDDIFASSQLGHLKSDEKFWQIVYDKIEVEDKNNILVWDNEEENLASAKSFGFKTKFYKSYEEFEKYVNDL